MATQSRPLDKMQSAIQLAAFHYIACLKAMPSNADHKLTIGKAEFHFENIRTADSRLLHGEFQRWAASAVLRDLVEHFSIFLMEVYRDAVMKAPGRTFAVTPSRFERRGIEDQLTILAAEFSVAPEWIILLTGYNRARNCLAHRAGIVDLPDATDGSELVVRWLVAKTALAEGPPSRLVDIQGPMGALVRGHHIHGVSAAIFELQDRENRVAVGSTLHFLPDEVLEICQTFQLVAAAFSEIGAGRV
ncbi:hypothetical protein GCM10011491_44960 [Brucella endophytica]|uniref:Uncharacterized protein n=1 Tax=Brucella endophytica TaxID=1963359 RepID=A0A916SQX7_9HYPH|nr:hypothetical protein [Brucella endophytica]GGB12102.1 hypothetical protein GCM10011491_44960 [Brucella endophytica]